MDCCNEHNDLLVENSKSGGNPLYPLYWNQWTSELEIYARNTNEVDLKLVGQAAIEGLIPFPMLLARTDFPSKQVKTNELFKAIFDGLNKLAYSFHAKREKINSDISSEVQSMATDLRYIISEYASERSVLHLNRTHTPNEMLKEVIDCRIN